MNKYSIDTNIFSTGNFLKTALLSVIFLTSHSYLVFYSFLLLNLIMQSHKSFLSINHTFSKSNTYQTFSHVKNLSAQIKHKDLTNILLLAKQMAGHNWPNLLSHFANWNIVANHSLVDAKKPIVFTTTQETLEKCLAFNILFPYTTLKIQGGNDEQFNKVCKGLRDYYSAYLQAKRNQFNQSISFLSSASEAYKRPFKIGVPYMLYADFLLGKSEFSLNIQLGNQYRLCIRQQVKYLWLRIIVSYAVLHSLPTYALCLVLLLLPYNSSESLFISVGFDPISNRSLQKNTNVYDNGQYEHICLNVYSVGHIIMNVLIHFAMLILLPNYFGCSIELNIMPAFLTIILAIDRVMLFLGIRLWLPFINLTSCHHNNIIKHNDDKVETTGHHISLNGIGIPACFIAPLHYMSYTLCQSNLLHVNNNFINTSHSVKL